ncbi:hypothetical protein AEAC466_18360 [Asticcacaulis sp. AC466]|nr:hypothetical protein AEAC466_18360 [Asticcacaulis sp. AC466]
MVATSLALGVVMGGIQHQNLPDVLPYVMAGILAFTLSGTYILNDAPEVYISSSNIIKNHAYPYTFYSFESVTRTFIIFLHNIVAFFIAMLILQRLAFPNWTLFIGLVVVYVNSFLWGTISSMLAARFRDLRFLLPFLQQMIFFLTPVFWQPQHMTGWRAAIIQFNPFFGLTELIRAPLLGHMPSILAWEQASISLGLGFIVWILAFGHYRGKIAFWI